MQCCRASSIKWIGTRQARKACKHVFSRRDLLSFCMMKNASRLLFGFSARVALYSVCVVIFISFCKINIDCVQIDVAICGPVHDGKTVNII